MITRLLETYFSTDEIEYALNRMCIRIIFVRHQWLAWAEPDPVNMQYDCIAQGLETVRRRFGWSAHSIVVWLDFTRSL